MMGVGGFPGMQVMNRRTIRGPINPLDQSTVVSIFPKPINERKCTIQPGIFNLAPGTVDRPAILNVGPSSWWRDIDEEMPLLEIPVASVQIAEAVVNDFCNGIVGCDMVEAVPGLFWLPGKLSANEVKKNFSQEIAKAELKQMKWYSVLIRMADSLWARSNGNPLAISDDMRLAARELNLHSSKDWMRDFAMVEMVRCKACGTPKSPEFPVCAACHFPDPDHPMTKQLLAAKGSFPTSSQPGVTG